MLTLLVSILAILAVPSPESSPSVPAPLKEIGHVESVSVCSAIVVHANSAIDVALENDGNLALTINHLRTTDLDDDNEIKRNNGMRDLSTLAGRIRLASATGIREIKRLRAMVEQTTEPTRKQELKAFVDALSGAIVRQRGAALDLDKMLTIIDGRRAIAELNTPELIGQRNSISRMDAGNGAPTIDTGIVRNVAAPPTMTRVDADLRSLAEDFQSRTEAILADEGNAADHTAGATTGC